MNLIEVVDLLKELVSDCSDLSGNDFLVAPSKLASSIVDGYEIHLSGNFNQETRQYLNDIALKKHLAITQHPDSIMIYQAKQLSQQKNII